jgi:hypothetical protein
MAGPDIVLFVVGALLFSGATAAIVTRDGGVGALGGAGSASGVFNVAYATRVIEGEGADVGSFASHTAEFDVNNTAVSKVILVIECSDPVPAGVPYGIHVEVTAPNGIAVDPVDVNCGNVEIPIDVTEVPADTSVQGRTEDEARANLPQDANATKAVGAWTVTITGSRGPSPLPLPAGTPNGRIALNVEAWEPSFAPVQK